jgi:undecaprenyl diphosphate synthase
MAVNYGGRLDIVDAVKTIITEGISADDVNEETLSSYLSTADEPDPDLFIRTSGEMRISNFLLYQLAYAEFYFTDTLWPDFDELEYFKALDCFAKRDRRFGGIGGS